MYIGGSSSSGEAGGPGISYFQGLTISNLRIDNGCQQPKVNGHSFYMNNATNDKKF